jgi:hypothetical protein
VSFAVILVHFSRAYSPKWDGKKEPKLLSHQSSSNIEFKKNAFD